MIRIVLLFYIFHVNMSLSYSFFVQAYNKLLWLYFMPSLARRCMLIKDVYFLPVYFYYRDVHN